MLRTVNYVLQFVSCECVCMYVRTYKYIHIHTHLEREGDVEDGHVPKNEATCMYVYMCRESSS